MAKRIWLFALVLHGCSGTYVSSEIAAMALGSLSEPSTPTAPLPGPAPCAITLNVSADLLAEAEAVASRLEAAAGCVVTLAEGGTEVFYGQPSVIEFDEALGRNTESRSCGQTKVNYWPETGAVASVPSIEVDDGSRYMNCASAESILMHETIHALVNRPGYTFAHEEHSASGAFMAKTGKETPMPLDESTLTELCSHVVCRWIAPEAE